MNCRCRSEFNAVHRYYILQKVGFKPFISRLISAKLASSDIGRDPTERDWIICPKG